jgi:hypothetical protein
MSAQIEDYLELIGLNIASGMFMLATFHWETFIPAPDRIIEWSVGLMVGVSIIVLNIVKAVNAYKTKKNT